jgi:hypothetical protein
MARLITKVDAKNNEANIPMKITCKLSLLSSSPYTFTHK